MNPDRKIDADKIHILDIKTLAGNIECKSQEDAKKVEAHRFEFELSNGLAVKDNIIGFKLVVDIVAIDKKGQPLSIEGSYTHEMIFKVDNLDDFVEKTDKGDMLDAGLGSTLVSIIYSTVRGIIYNRTQGTSLGVVTLPVVAPLRLMGLEDKTKGQSGGKKDKELPAGSDKKKAKLTKQPKG